MGLLDTLRAKGLLSGQAALDFTRGGLMGAVTDTMGYIPDAVADAMRPFGYNVPREQVIGGSDWWANKLTSPTGSNAETAGRFVGGLLAPGPMELMRAGGMLGKRPPIQEVVAYHGTAGDFDAFDKSMRGKLTGARSAKKAIWLTDDTKTAGAYSVYAAEDGPVKAALDDAARYERMAHRYKDNRYWDKYDEAIRRAEELDTYAARLARREAQAHVKKVDIPDNIDLLEVDAKGLTPQELAEAEDIDSWINAMVDEAQKLGKAGVKFKNLDDAVGLSNRPSTHYAIFDPSILKIIGKE